MKNPYLIDFNKHGNNSLGYLVALEENTEIPFLLKRVYWTFDIPNGIVRGHHAHKITEQVLICIQGNIEVEIIKSNGEKSNYILNDSTKGLYLPPDAWHTMTYNDNAIQLVIASEKFEESDYIRDFNNFINNKYQ